MNWSTPDGWRFVVPSSSPRPPVRCQKCAGASTRAHHRRCPKRGLGQLGRGERVRRMEHLVVGFALTFQVRRGRRGRGLSLPIVEGKINRLLRAHGGATKAELEALAAETLRIAPSRVEVKRGDAPGAIFVTIAGEVGARALHRVHDALHREIPGSMHLEVRSVDSVVANPILPG